MAGLLVPRWCQSGSALAVIPLFLSSLLLLLLPPTVNANQEYQLFEQGQQLYKRCQGCHQIGPDAMNQFGPPLNGLTTRGAGDTDNFDYSPGFRAAVEKGLKWDEFTLDAFLAKPMEYIPGTKMTYPGVDSAEERKALIVYLSHVDENGTVTIEPVVESEKVVEPKQRPIAAAAPIPEHGVLHLGRPALEEEIVAWDIDIRPDGQGLPPGRGDALEGVEIYDVHCNACHGDFGEGIGRWPVLAGGRDTLTDERPEKTIGSYWPYLSTVFDYVRRAMPFGNARSLSDDDVYAVTAYLLYLNDIVDEDFELTSENFNAIEMPNEAGFTVDSRAGEKHYQANAEPCMRDCIPGTAIVIQRARILDVTPDE